MSYSHNKQPIFPGADHHGHSEFIGQWHRDESKCMVYNNIFVDSLLCNECDELSKMWKMVILS